MLFLGLYFSLHPHFGFCFLLILMLYNFWSDAKHWILPCRVLDICFPTDNSWALYLKKNFFEALKLMEPEHTFSVGLILSYYWGSIWVLYLIPYVLWDFLIWLLRTWTIIVSPMSAPRTVPPYSFKWFLTLLQVVALYTCADQYSAADLNRVFCRSPVCPTVFFPVPLLCEWQPAICLPKLPTLPFQYRETVKLHLCSYSLWHKM